VSSSATTEVVFSAEFVRNFIARWQDAWNSHEPERVVALCTEDIVLSDPALSEPARGRDAVRRYLEDTWRAFPDLTITTPEPGLVDVEGRRVALPWRITGTMLGPDPSGFAPTGARAEVAGVDLYDFREGLLARIRTTYDIMGWGRQLGLVPPRGSRAERVAIHLQRLGAGRQRRKNARAID
jgi:steroid delta-isomerase-like uncharacterized protein